MTWNSSMRGHPSRKLLLPIVDGSFGTETVMAVQVVGCIAGALLNRFCVQVGEGDMELVHEMAPLA